MEWKEIVLVVLSIIVLSGLSIVVIFKFEIREKAKKMEANSFIKKKIKKLLLWILDGITG